jgi:tRNA threonylcarbamoyladenosine biosynthesis protein TsaE
VPGERAVVMDETALRRWGERIGRELRHPVVLALRGDLGAGKSTLARAVARGAGVIGPVPSPTFNLLFRYEPGDRPVLHLDLYRLERPEEVWELGWGEWDEALVMIEWPERAEALLPEPRWEVRLEEEDDPELRRVVLRAVGDAPPLPAFTGPVA